MPVNLSEDELQLLAAGEHLLAGAEQAAQYREWALSVAEKVAMASTEGGFLGFGGTRLSDAEKALIEQLKTALKA